MRRYGLLLAGFLSIFWLLSACQPQQQSSPDQLHLLIKDGGKQQQVSADPELTVADVLREAGIELSDLDRVNPPTYSRVASGMTITIVRVTEDTVVTQEPIAFDRRTTLNDGLPTGQTRLLQAGVNGVAEITFRVTYEDGVEVSRSEVRRVAITAPQPEVIMIGSQGQLSPVPVNGTLAYISSGNAWIIRRNSSNRRPLTLDGGVDGRVFQLSQDGRRLLFTRNMAQAAPPSTPGAAQATLQPTPTYSGAPFNTLWLVLDTGDPQSKPIQLKLGNILYADFMPNDSHTIVYSTAEPRPNFPGWQANNDLWLGRLGSKGNLIDSKLLLQPSSGGIYGWFGTVFAMSPDGATLAWAQADAIGILKPGPKEKPDKGQLPNVLERQTILSLTPRNAFDFVWVPSLAWSPDGALLATTTHGAPVSGEAPEDSPIFNLTLLPAQGGYSVDIADRAGMWAAPQFSPAVSPEGKAIEVMIVYLRALQPLDSARSRYQLILSDRDGSNSRPLFPPVDQPGIASQIVEWSPDAQQIALTYQGNLILLDVATGLTQQLTQDGQSGSPVWRP